jgi:hypothetical protein
MPGFQPRHEQDEGDGSQGENRVARHTQPAQHLHDLLVQELWTLLEPHVSEFNISGRSMKGWVLVVPEGVEDDDELNGWIQRAVKFVGSLPAK